MLLEQKMELTSEDEYEDTVTLSSEVSSMSEPTPPPTASTTPSSNSPTNLGQMNVSPEKTPLDPTYPSLFFLTGNNIFQILRGARNSLGVGQMSVQHVHVSSPIHIEIPAEPEPEMQPAPAPAPAPAPLVVPSLSILQLADYLQQHPMYHRFNGYPEWGRLLAN